MNFDTILTTHIERLSNQDTVVRHEAVAAQVEVPQAGSEFVCIPGGRYLLGKEGMGDNPLHEVTLLNFHISRNLVTVGQYMAYCEATGKNMPPAPDFNPHWSKIDHPIVRVMWEEARGYALWAGGDLPTEAEWEVAARGGLVSREYPWGDEFDESRLHCSVKIYRNGGTIPVGSYPPNGYGLYDMAGNTREWCVDGKGLRHILRGGSWIDDVPASFCCARRDDGYPTYRSFLTGFRIVIRG